MLQAADRHQVRSIVHGWRQQGLSTALVPTMGNLHEGHLALVEAAREQADRVVASIYVNPTQFVPGEDFAGYPRTMAADKVALQASGCDLLFAPDHATVYPFGIDNATRVIAPPDIASPLEGQFRPGHFDGVLTVVARLFNLVSADAAVFGEKDFQQILVIRRMVEDLSFNIRIIQVPTVRENNGLALSSRNSYLDSAQGLAAAELSSVLNEVVEEVRNEPARWMCAEEAAAARLETVGLKVDYVAVRSARDLTKPAEKSGELVVLAAAWCGATRLIDNMKII
jgi:pantoate--beta-alanine ligase